jgi:CHAD domain-containing protein
VFQSSSVSLHRIAADELRRHESVRQGLVRVARFHYQTLCGLRAEGPVDQVVHQTRVTCKRMRALWRLIEPSSDPAWVKAEDRALRNAARALSSYRDRDVARPTLETLLAAESSPSIKLSLDLLGLSQSSGDTVSPEWTEAIEQAVDHGLATLEESLRQLRTAPLLAGGWSALAPGLEASYRQGRRDWRLLLRKSDDDCFHDWRKRVKALYFQLCFLRSMDPDGLEPVIEGLRKLGNTLGREHDLQILRDQAQDREKNYRAVVSFSPLHKRVAKALARLRKKALRQGEVLYGGKTLMWSEAMGARWRNWKTPQVGKQEMIPDIRLPG